MKPTLRHFWKLRYRAVSRETRTRGRDSAERSARNAATGLGAGCADGPARAVRRGLAALRGTAIGVTPTPTGRRGRDALPERPAIAVRREARVATAAVAVLIATAFAIRAARARGVGGRIDARVARNGDARADSAIVARADRVGGARARRAFGITRAAGARAGAAGVMAVVRHHGDVRRCTHAADGLAGLAREVDKADRARNIVGRRPLIARRCRVVCVAAADNVGRVRRSVSHGTHGGAAREEQKRGCDDGERGWARNHANAMSKRRANRDRSRMR